MYHGGVLNGEINRILGNLRHTDRICIADCGLPLKKSRVKAEKTKKYF